MKQGCPTNEYGNNFSAAYLDGCSIVVNHIEAASEDVRQLCVDLRDDFPHAYVNSYLTPPQAQAVAPHADDRDVLVWQTAGKKKWKVYGDPPVPFPFTLEQVGKYDECPVPEETLASKPLLDITLEAGDILYMPRGFVHEAFTSHEPSLHLTIALATHDWSWSRVASRALTGAGGLTEDAVASFQSDVDSLDTKTNLWRHSIPPCLLCEGGIATGPQRDASVRILERMTQEINSKATKTNAAETITSALLLETLRGQVEVHNRRQDAVRPPCTKGRCLTQDSFVRRLTEEEKVKIEKAKAEAKEEEEEEEEEGGPSGLVARDEIADALMDIIASCTTTPIAVKDFKDAPMLCPFSKVCFAQVCVGLGILAPCEKGGGLL